MTIAHKRLIKTTHILAFAILLASVGCKSTKVTTKPRSGLDYATQTAFEKVFFEADKQRLLNNFQKSTELYVKALEIHPESHACMYQLAKLYYKGDKYVEALYWAEKSVASSPQFNHWYSGQLAQFYNKFGKYEKSANVFSQMIDSEPDVRKNYTEAASQYFNAKQYDKSIDALVRMQAQFGIEMESATRLEYIYTALNKPDKAIESLQKLVNKYPADIQYKGFLAETLMNAGRRKEAIKLLEEVVQAEPNSGKAYFALYSVYSEAGEDDKALEYLENAYRQDDVTLQQKLQVMNPYFAQLQGNPKVKKVMLTLSDILLQDYSSQLEPYMFRADIHGTLGEFTEARKYIRLAIEQNSSDYKLWSKLILLNVRLEDDKQQIKDTKEALELFPSMTEIYIAKGYAHLEEKQFQEAVDITEEGMDVAIDASSKIELLQCQASSYSALNNTTRSDKAYEQILKLDPNHTLALNNYAFSLANRKIELDKAESMIDKALLLERGNPYFLDTKAWILFAKKEYKEALRILDQCMEIDPKNPEYYIHAKTIFETIGNLTMANEMQLKIDRLNESR